MAHSIYPSLLYLWDKRTLYIGPLFETLELSQGAATLLIALDKPIYFYPDGQEEPIACRSLLLPAGMAVRVDTRDAIIANCNLDPFGADFDSLSKLMQHKHQRASYQLSCEQHFIYSFWEIYRSQLESKPAYQCIERLLSSHNELDSEIFVVDKRVVDVIKLIKKTINDNLSVEELASTVNLSSPRLVQLFKKQTGIPIRRYRLWHRLYVTAIRVGLGESLTEAAIAAGFNDSSHYCHTFRSMLGMKPSFLAAQPNKLRIIIPENNALLEKENHLEQVGLENIA